MEVTVIETTVGLATEALSNLDAPSSKPVRIIVGQPSLTEITDRIATAAAARGMTDDTFKDIMEELGYAVPCD